MNSGFRAPQGGPSGAVATLLQLVRADTFPNLVIDGDGGPR